MLERRRPSLRQTLYPLTAFSWVVSPNSLDAQSDNPRTLSVMPVTESRFREPECPPPRLNESLRIRLICCGWDGNKMDHSDTDHLIACPSCGAAMRFLQTARSNRIFRELQTFECRPCHLTVTAEQVLLQFPELLSA